jgi:MYXO-CTERM domain-containing protein
MRIATLASLLVLAGTAHAHIQMTSPSPRSLDQKAPPCGRSGSTRGSVVTTFQPGETITVTWDETVDHPGHYRIAFDDNGDDIFQNPNNPDDNFASTLMEPIADKVGGKYTAQVTLPTTPCTNCTLQLVQVMTTQVPYNSFYYQCADITISGDPGEEEPPELDGGGCSTTGGAGFGAALLALGLARRRRRT